MKLTILGLFVSTILLFTPVYSGVTLAPAAAAICAIWVSLGAVGEAAIAALVGGPAAAAIIRVLEAESTDCVVLVSGLVSITCFDENAMVQTSTGPVPIQHLAVGDKLIHYSNSDVVEVSSKKGVFTFLEIGFQQRAPENGLERHGAINVTANHVMLVNGVNGQALMKPALYVTVGDEMQDKEGNIVVVRGIRPFIKYEKFLLRTSNGMAVVNEILTTALCDISPFEKLSINVIEKDEYFSKYHETLVSV